MCEGMKTGKAIVSIEFPEENLRFTTTVDRFKLEYSLTEKEVPSEDIVTYILSGPKSIKFHGEGKDITDPWKWEAIKND